jgi:Uma2 family endonuclease
MSRQVGNSATALEPTWEIARFFPLQGAWTEDEYLELEGNQRVEFSDGFLEFPPLPTMSHQLIVAFLYGALTAYVSARGLGVVLFAGIRVKVARRTIREPDVVYMANQHVDRIGERVWQGADLVIEVVSGSRKDRQRDFETKRLEYARGGIAEYWIVDPKEERITVLRLRGKRYVVHGEFARSGLAVSHLLDGFAVDVREVFTQNLRITGAKLPKKPKRHSQEQ